MGIQKRSLWVPVAAPEATWPGPTELLVTWYAKRCSILNATAATSKNGMARPTYSDAELAALLKDPVTTPSNSNDTTATPTTSDKTAAGGGRTAEGVQHHQRQARGRNEELSNRRADKGGPSTTEGVADAHQKAMEVAAREQIELKAEQE